MRATHPCADDAITSFVLLRPFSPPRRSDGCGVETLAALRRPSPAGAARPFESVACALLCPIVPTCSDVCSLSGRSPPLRRHCHRHCPGPTPPQPTGLVRSAARSQHECTRCSSSSECKRSGCVLRRHGSIRFPCPVVHPAGGGRPLPPGPPSRLRLVRRHPPGHSRRHGRRVGRQARAATIATTAAETRISTLPNDAEQKGNRHGRSRSQMVRSSAHARCPRRGCSGGGVVWRSLRALLAAVGRERRRVIGREAAGQRCGQPHSLIHSLTVTAPSVAVCLPLCLQVRSRRRLQRAGRRAAGPIDG